VTSAERARPETPMPTPRMPGRAAVSAPPACKREQRAVGASPAAVAISLEQQIVADDAPELAAFEHDDPPAPGSRPRRSTGKSLFEAIAFAIAVEDAGDRRDAPVHDVDPVGGVEKAQVPEQVVDGPLPFIDAEVGDVGDRRLGKPLQGTASQAMANGHVVQQRRQIVVRSADGVVAERAQRVL